MSDGAYDAIVVGGGHNGLVAGRLPRPGRSAHRRARGPRRHRRRRRHRAAVGRRLQGHRAVVRDEPDAADDHRATCASTSTATRSCRWGRASSPSPTAATCWPTTRRPVTSTRWPSSPGVTPSGWATTKHGCEGSPTCSRRCCCARRHVSARGGPRTCSTSCARRGDCAASTCGARPRRPGCSRCPSPTCSTSGSSRRRSRACWRSTASSARGPARRSPARPT